MKQVKLNASMRAKANGFDVGILFPATALEVAPATANVIKNTLANYGFSSQIFYANDALDQSGQVNSCLENNCSLIIVWPIDSEALQEILLSAKEEGVLLISFINHFTEEVEPDCYVGYDPYEVGKQQGEYIKGKLDLENGNGPFYIELFEGNPAQALISQIFEGAMEVLQPYIDTQQLIAGEPVVFQEVSKGAAKEIMSEKLLELGGDEISVVYCTIDIIASGVIEALVERGYSSDNMPLITGFGGDEEAKQNITDGLQSMTVEIPFDSLGQNAAEIAYKLLSGGDLGLEVGSGGYPVFCEITILDDDSGGIIHPVELVSIEINNQNGVVYYVGEEFPNDKLKVTANFSNGLSRTVTDYCNYSIKKLVAAGTYNLEVTYRHLTVTCSETVSIIVKERILEAIEITKPPKKVAYYIGEDFNPQGMEVTAIYNNGDRALVNDYVYQPQTIFGSSFCNIEVSYTEAGVTKTADLTVTIKRRMIGISVSKVPDKILYYSGERLNTSGMRVLALYEDESSSDLPIGQLEFTPRVIKFDNFSDTAKIEVSYRKDGSTYTASFTVRRKTVVEFDDCNITQDFGAGGSGNVNLYSGRLLYNYVDFNGSGSAIPLNIVHIQDSEKAEDFYGLGNGWRLNFNQEVVRTDGKWRYTDKTGKDYYFEQGFDTKDGRSSVRNETLGFDLFEDSKAKECRLVDRKNNTLVFNYHETGINQGYYRLAKVHQYPSTPENPVGEYMLGVQYNESGFISKVYEGDGINTSDVYLSAVFSYKTQSDVTMLQTITCYRGTEQVYKLQYQYSEYRNLTEINCVENGKTTQTTKFSYLNEFSVTNEASKSPEGDSLSLRYSIEIDDDGRKRISGISVGYGETDRETTSITYGKSIKVGKDSLNIVNSTVLRRKNTTSVISFNQYGACAQYSYDKKSGTITAVNESVSNQFSYQEVANAYSDTLNYPIGSTWNGGTETSSLFGGDCRSVLLGSAAVKTITLDKSVGSETTMYCSMWMKFNNKFTNGQALTIAIRQNGKNYGLTFTPDTSFYDWQYVAFRLGRLKQNDIIQFTFNGPMLVDGLRVVKAPYEIPEDMPEAEYDTFGNVVKNYQYNPVDGKISNYTYSYDRGHQLTELVETVDDEILRKIVYGYQNGLPISATQYGKASEYTKETTAYRNYVMSQSTDANGVQTQYAQGGNWTRTTLVGDAGSPSFTVEDTLLTNTVYTKDMFSGKLKNEYKYDEIYRINGLRHNAFTTDIEYDTYGNVSCVRIGENPLRATYLARYEYDSKHLNSIEYGNGAKINYGYDEDDRLISLTDKDGVSIASISYTENPAGEATQTIVNSCGVTYIGRTVLSGGVVDEFETDFGDNGKVKTVSYALNGAGNKTKGSVYLDDSRTAFETQEVEKDRDGTIIAINRSGHGASVSYSYDDNYRLATKQTKYNKRTFKNTYGYKTISGSRTSNRLSRDSFNNGSGADSVLTYEYYENGNLKAVYEDNVKQVSYVYDEYNRLTEEKNYRLGEGWICEYSEVMTSGAVDYNKGGNIVSKRRYVLENGNFGAEIEPFLYGYSSGNAETNATWHDQLKTMNGGIVKYDKAGNSTYLLGHTYEWHGRRLIKADDVEMEYDAAGLRTKKGNTVYFWQGDRLVREKTGEEEIYYYYDESGVSGINYNGKEYYFRKNMLGDVIAIYASNGALQCRYVYSAWGDHEIFDASGNQIKSGDNIGIKNPIRYRGYYYDSDLHLYYLQSRYYEPILGRFLSPDSPQNLDPATIQGLNLYTYCLNNSISYVDPNGSVAILTAALIGLLIGAIVGTVIGAVVAGVISYNSGARGWELAGDILFGAFLGSVIGGIAGLLIGAGIGAAPAIGSFLGSSFTLGSFVTAGGELVAVSVTGAQIAAAGALGLAIVGNVLMKNSITRNPNDPSKPHRGTKNGKHWDKHTKKRSGAPEKKDSRMKYHKWKRGMLFPFLFFFDYDV